MKALKVGDFVQILNRHHEETGVMRRVERKIDQGRGIAVQNPGNKGLSRVTNSLRVAHPAWTHPWPKGSRKGDSRVTPGASDTFHPEEPHYGNVGNTINPNTGGYDGF